MRPTRAALLLAATALTPALLFTAPAFADDASASSVPVAPYTPFTPPAVACPAEPSGTETPVDELTEDELQAEVQGILADPNAGPYVLRAANAALAGTVDGLRTFLETGCTTAQSGDDVFWVARVIAVAQQNGDHTVWKAGSDAITASETDVNAARVFLETGYPVAQVTDDYLAVARISAVAQQNGDAYLLQAASDAFEVNTPEAVSYFRWTGYKDAQYKDDQLYVVRMLNDPDLSDAMNDAIQDLLSNGTAEDFRYFRTVGQYEIDG
ncbi:ALF repeat-containing protein [Streptomyces sp. NPDC060184]|uniref:ALF repeat-containing protein n=1 Tax=Streptomyces sp. NPDC060184 TaxID=3347064 RepID=UPI00364A701D